MARVARGEERLRVRTPKYFVVSCSLARISLSASAANSKVIKRHNVAHTPCVAWQKQTQRGREETEEGLGEKSEK